MSGQLAVSGLSVSFGGVPVLAGVSLTLGRAESLSIVGESGSGKSTLAMAIAGLLPPDAAVSGTIDWQASGRPPRCGPDVGVIFQDPAGSLDPVMPAGSQIAEVARANLGVPAGEARRMAREMLVRVGFPDPDPFLSAFSHQLSGGQAQRIAIACALAARPKLLIADEATSALDTIVQAEIASLLERLVAEEGLSLLFITHDLALARRMSGRVAVLRAGHIVREGPFDDVLRDPGDAYVRRLLDSRIGLSDPPLAARP